MAVVWLQGLENEVIHTRATVDLLLMAETKEAEEVHAGAALRRQHHGEEAVRCSGSLQQPSDPRAEHWRAVSSVLWSAVLLGGVLFLAAFYYAYMCTFEILQLARIA